ncbi:MAG TPA: tetratricopeptide repeat protein [Blastocatellia bacterium]|jgi:tetratricopeptide (TPR) repeat protein
MLSAAIYALRAIPARPGRWDDRPKAASSPRAPAAQPAVAGKQIELAELLIAREPSRPDAYNLLGAACLQKARETGDFSFNARAERAINRSLELDPNNIESRILHATLLLAQHRFKEALESARRAERERPRDPVIFGILTDALVELGDYDNARIAADRMLTLRPDVSSYARVSYLRSLYGDGEGAIEAMRAAVRAAGPREPESLAWCRVHLGDELLNAGRIIEAEREYDLALGVFPDYHIALAAKARARIAAGDFTSAIENYKRAQQRVPLPDTAMALGDLYKKTGREDEANRQYELVEFIERAGAAGTGTYSRQMALFRANQGIDLDEALEAAMRERSLRSDIYTCDTLAWCLLKTGRVEEAIKAIKEAMRLGTRDAQIFYHAGMIYAAAGDRSNAAKHLSRALEINPSFDLLQSGIAKQTLDNIGGQGSLYEK